MRAFRIYISCPIALPNRVLSKYVSAAEALKANVSYWRRGTTYGELPNILACDAFVIILPQEQFNCSLSSLPPGCRLELKEAEKAGKSIYIGYTPADRKAKFYEAAVAGAIRGVAGTSDNLPEIIKTYETKSFSNFLEFLGTNPKIGKKSAISTIIIPVPRI